jgi:hypothetical protein
MSNPIPDSAMAPRAVTLDNNTSMIVSAILDTATKTFQMALQNAVDTEQNVEQAARLPLEELAHAIAPSIWVDDAAIQADEKLSAFPLDLAETIALERAKPPEPVKRPSIPGIKRSHDDMLSGSEETVAQTDVAKFRAATVKVIVAARIASRNAHAKDLVVTAIQEASALIAETVAVYKSFN